MADAKRYLESLEMKAEGTLESVKHYRASLMQAMKRVETGIKEDSNCEMQLISDLEFLQNDLDHLLEN